MRTLNARNLDLAAIALQEVRLEIESLFQDDFPAENVYRRERKNPKCGARSKNDQNRERKFDRENWR